MAHYSIYVGKLDSYLSGGFFQEDSNDFPLAKINSILFFSTDSIISLCYFHFVFEVWYVKVTLESESHAQYLIDSKIVRTRKVIMILDRGICSLVLLIMNILVVWDQVLDPRHTMSVATFVFMRLFILLCDLYMMYVYQRMFRFFFRKKRELQNSSGGVLSKFSKFLIKWSIFLSVAFSIRDITNIIAYII